MGKENFGGPPPLEDLPLDDVLKMGVEAKITRRKDDYQRLFGKVADKITRSWREELEGDCLANHMQAVGELERIIENPTVEGMQLPPSATREGPEPTTSG